MFSQSITRSTRNILTASRVTATTQRCFHASPRACIAVGDKIPSVELKEDSPGNKIDIAEEVNGKKGKVVIVGVPAAFSPACSASHIPSFIEHKEIKNIPTYVVSVNDPFVMKAWKESFPKASSTGIRFLADGKGEFAKKMDMIFDQSSEIFGTLRNKRYAVLVEDGTVKKVFSEPDNTGVKETVAEKVFAGL